MRIAIKSETVTGTAIDFLRLCLADRTTDHFSMPTFWGHKTLDRVRQHEKQRLAGRRRSLFTDLLRRNSGILTTSSEPGVPSVLGMRACRLLLHLELGLDDIGLAAAVERLRVRFRRYWMRVHRRQAVCKVLRTMLLFGPCGHSPRGNAALDKAIEMHAAKAAAPSLNDMEALCYPNR